MDRDLTPIPRERIAATVVCALVPPLLYLLFISHYGTDVIYQDEWNVVPLIHAALHHDLRFSQLWTQHNENRMFAPNLVFVAFGVFDHFNTKSIMYLSALLFIGSYLTTLVLYKNYVGHALGYVKTIVVGFVWFSPVMWENSLWGFQLAWFMFVAALLGMTYCFSRPRMTPYSFGAAVVLALIASYSSIQGLLLWPVGLLCVLWRLHRRRGRLRYDVAWSVVAIASTALYFAGFDFGAASTGGGSVQSALRHPVGTAKYAFVLIGGVFPGLGLNLTAAVGLLITVAAGFCLYQFARRWGHVECPPVPLVLIVFGLLFDLTVAVGRASQGIRFALSSRYALASMVILVGIALTVFARSPVGRLPSPSAPPEQFRPYVPMVIAVGALVMQMFFATSSLTTAAHVRNGRVNGARTLVNLDRLTPAQQTVFVHRYLFPSLKEIKPWIAMAEDDHLSALRPGSAYAEYRREGPPSLNPRAHVSGQ